MGLVNLSGGAVEVIVVSSGGGGAVKNFVVLVPPSVLSFVKIFVLFPGVVVESFVWAEENSWVGTTLVGLGEMPFLAR